MTETTQQPENEAVNYKGYEVALQLAFYEGQISWQMNVLFVGLNIGIGTILQNKLDDFCHKDPLTISMSIVGLIINILWLATFLRNNRYYDFRMAQARSLEPNEYSLVNGNGYDFSQGDEVELHTSSGSGPSKHKLSKFERAGRNKFAIMASIICFLIGFLILLIISLIPTSS
ncbi:hypothetical protein [Flavobacterium lindanitolerans]|uniref:hypothetical protein n=1 Tax=Flavobacterium lindanitolerans TaxID=428988 RepID=UPI0031D87395